MGEHTHSRRGWPRRWRALAGLAAAACTSPVPAPFALPTAAERRAAEAAGFELPGVGSAAEIAPSELLQGPNYVLADEVYTDRFTHVFTVESDFGTFTAEGDDMLRRRIGEVEALAALEEMSKSREFAAAVGKALASPFVATWNVITDPVSTIVGIPKSAWETLRRTAELARNDRGELEDSAFSEFVGFEAKKRQVAAALGVDPYSSNEVLQRELNRFAWAAYAGSLPAMFVPFRGEAEGERTAGAAAVSEDEHLQQILLQYSPEDLARLNRIELAVMGVPHDVGDAFIHHSWYSPRTETAVIENLAALDLAQNRRAFIEAALTAESERDAHFYQRTAELMRRYNESEGRIREIINVGGAVTAYADDGTLVVPLAADRAVWSEATAALTDAFTGGVPPEFEIQRTELVLSGTLSPKARAEIEARGVAVVENAFTAMQIPVDVPAAHEE